MSQGIKTSEVDMERPSLLGEEDIDKLVKRPKLRRRRGWVITLMVVLLIALLGGGLLTYLRASRQPSVQYRQQAVSVGNLSVTISATGPIKANAEYDLNFTTSGHVNRINVQVGQRVKAGQTLATLNSVSLQDALAAAQHKVTSAQIAYNDAYNSGASQPVLDQDNANIIAAQDNLQAAQDSLAATVLTAPHAATVVEINGVVGEDVGTGSSGSTSQPFIVLLDTSSLAITGQVNEADIANVQVGQPAQFTVSAYPSQTFRATVSVIDTSSQTTSNVVSYPITLTVNQQSINAAHLYPGMTATVNITTAQRIGVLLVPAAALSFPSVALQSGELDRTTLRSLFTGVQTGTGTTQGSRGFVLELRNGKLTPVVVTTGLSNGQYTEVLSGLNAGDEVVVGQTGGTTPTSSPGGSGSPRNGSGLFRLGQ